MAGFTQFETDDRVLNTRMNAFGNELFSQITKYSTYDLYLKQGNLMNPQKPTGAGTEVIFANVTNVEKLAYTFNYAIPEDLIISKDNRYNLVIPFKQLDVNRSFVFRFLYKHEGTTIFDITRNAVTTATGDLTVEFQALNQNVVDIIALANTTVTLQIFVKTLSGTDAQISLLVNDVNALGRLSRNEATAIISADNVLMPDGTTSVSSAIGQIASDLETHKTEKVSEAILTFITTTTSPQITTVNLSVNRRPKKITINASGVNTKRVSWGVCDENANQNSILRANNDTFGVQPVAIILCDETITYTGETKGVVENIRNGAFDIRFTGVLRTLSLSILVEYHS